MIKHVLFDLDGTLLDTREGILESAAYAASALGYPALPRETLLQFVGPPIQQSFMTHYGCDAPAAQRAANLFRNYYKDRALLKAEPYPGIYRLCDALRDRGIDMAVATYKREDYALTLLEHFGFDRYCAVMHGADNENRLKKEDIVEMCLRELGAARADSVLVGDTVHDALGAARAGLPFIAVTYGFGFKTPEDVREHPHIGVAETPMEIEDIVSGGRA